MDLVSVPTWPSTLLAAPSPLPAQSGALLWELVLTRLGAPPRPSGVSPANSGAQACVTPTNRTGFLCHDRRSCIPASGVCDGVRSCTHGEDEDEAMCRECPLSPALPRVGPHRSATRLGLPHLQPQQRSQVPAHTRHLHVPRPLLTWSLREDHTCSLRPRYMHTCVSMLGMPFLCASPLKCYLHQEAFPGSQSR